MSESSVGGWFLRPVVWVGLIVVVALVGLVVWSPWSGGGVLVLAADELGPDPFATGEFAEAVPVELIEVQDRLAEVADGAGSLDATVVSEGAGSEGAEAAAAASKARVDAVVAAATDAGLPVVAPSSPVGVGLYGGSGVNACDAEGLKGFFAENPEEAAAFARVQGIEADGLDGFIDGLTAGFLLADTRVVNHGFKNGEEYPIDAILKAGTAVMVDDQGIPRLKCKCGNPLARPGPARLAAIFEDTLVCRGETKCYFQKIMGCEGTSTRCGRPGYVLVHLPEPEDEFVVSLSAQGACGSFRIFTTFDGQDAPTSASLHDPNDMDRKEVTVNFGPAGEGDHVFTLDLEMGRVQNCGSVANSWSINVSIDYPNVKAWSYQ